MLKRFIDNINAKNLVASVNPWLIAVSGGLDSACLVRLCKDAGISFGIAHCNFALRGGESEDDESFVKEMALEYGVPFFNVKFDTKEFAIINKVSIQVAARNLRYDWFEQVRKENAFACIATAHHLSDNMETMLINQLPGTGIEGLHGIKSRNGYIIRPLLFASRNELSEYASQNNILFREDSSNGSDKYLRNAIRHHIIPEFKKLESEVEQVFSDNALKIENYENLTRVILKKFWGKASFIKDHNLHISIEYLKKELEDVTNIQQLLYFFLKEYGFNYASVSDVVTIMDGESGKKIISATHTIIKDREHLILIENTENDDEELVIETVSHNGLVKNDFTFEFINREKFEQTEHKFQVAYLDFDKIKFPLIIRNWKHGDKMKPLGMSGSKLISDILTDNKISSSKKIVSKVILSENSIIWLAGIRISEDYKITEETVNILKISC
ncbi:MAG: tRNA lysidine(34) synthetase TilS [Bacteroidia bacterium]|nr:tRNA lysidine(34) synthetase TilS [Bacteroidia bacterium]